MPGIQVRPGYKFAVLALSDIRATLPFDSVLPLGERLALSSALPDSAMETWRDSIGRLHLAELEKKPLFVWALTQSTSPEVLDGENISLQHEAHRLYLGLLIAIPFLSSGRITLLSGGNSGDGARVRSFTTYPRTYGTIGAPMPAVTVSRARAAAALANALVTHDLQYPHGRFVRALRTFREACEAFHLDQRLHQFVRALEGFAVPPFRNSGDHFALRLKRICAGPASRRLKEMYTIRGGIEHLHGPYDRLPKGTDREQWTRLAVRCIEAEAIARYMVLTYLQNEQLWPHFESRTAVNTFWVMKAAEFRRLWPTRILFSAIAKEINFPLLKREFAPALVTRSTTRSRRP